MNQPELPPMEKAEAIRLIAIDRALQLQKNASSPELLIHNAKIIEAYLLGNK